MANDKKPGNDFVHGIRFWKRQSFPNEPRTRLSQSAIPTLHVVGLPTTFANTLMCLYWKDELIRFPEIAVALASPIGLWNLLPKFAAGRLTTITDDKGYDLTCSTTHHRPNPTFVPPFVNKWPHFVGFQHIFGFGGQKRLFKLWIAFVFFLAKPPVSDDSRQKCVVHRAYWSVPGRQTESVPSALRCSHALAQGLHACHSPCIRIVDCHSHYDHFWWCFGFRIFDICIQSVLRSCPYYTSYHFNLTTTKNSNIISKL